jgi:hypothetical protein
MMLRKQLRRVSEWLAATLEMWCPERGCGFDSRALRSQATGANDASGYYCWLYATSSLPQCCPIALVDAIIWRLVDAISIVSPSQIR